MFLEYVLSVHREDLLRILSDISIYNTYSVNVDFLNLFEADPNTGDGVLCNPKNTLAKCDKDLIKAQQNILDEESPTSQKKLSLKQNVHARFYGLPVCPELHRITIPKNKDLGCFLKVTGTAVRVTQSKMLEYRRSYKCLKCQYIQVVAGKYEQRYVIKAPTRCRNPDIQCRSSAMSPVNAVTRENCKDYQELKIQEQVNKLSVGGIPGSIWVTLEDDLVDCCKPGDDLNICGIVTRRWNPSSNNKKCDVELVFKANHVEVCNAQKAIAVSIAPDVIKDFDEFWSKYKMSPMKGRDVVLASVCPKVYGLYMVKLALALTVITGSSHNLERDNSSPRKTLSPKEEQDRSVRGQCHLLLVGDPGTGKSQLLKAGAMMTSRSVLTSGSGSTKAGLTCTALREDGEWQLEAGALVLADGGACCIDELAQMREHDRASIHEAMEQQTISVAKAGIICKLNTRCAVIAACNPKGNYDTEQALSVNVSLGTPLLSRFDLIFILLDTLNQEWDNLVADYVLYGKTSESSTLCWPLEKLQLYISLIGPYEVSISQDANIILRAYYVRQRRAEHRDPSRTTVRMLDSLVRLSQAHARLMYRHIVLPMDAVTAVSLMDLSMQDCTLSDTSDALHSTFSKYPDFEYLKTAKNLLSSLNLYEIWHSELNFYSKLLNISRQQLENDINNNDTKYFPQNSSSDETLKDNENVTEIVESSFFNPRKVNDNNDEKECKNKTAVSNEELDLILDLGNSSNFSSVSPKIKQNAGVSHIKQLVEVPEVDKSSNLITDKHAHVSKVLLAQSLKKHSSMNKFTNSNSVGIITGKRKLVNNKSTDQTPNAKKVKGANTKNIDSSMQTVLNELNHNSVKTKKNQKKIKKQCSIKKKSNILEVSVSSSSSDEEINEKTMLQYLPSVNDVFRDISAHFDQSNDDDDLSMFENSQPLQECGSVNNKPNSFKNSVSTLRNKRNQPNQVEQENILCDKGRQQPNDTEQENILCDKGKQQPNDTEQENILCDKRNRPNQIENELKISHLATFERLQQFCFRGKGKSENSSDLTENLENSPFKSNEHCRRENNCNSDLDDLSLENASNLQLVKNITCSGKNSIKNSQTFSSNKGPSQISIFENDDENFGVLDSI